MTPPRNTPTGAPCMTASPSRTVRTPFPPLLAMHAGATWVSTGHLVLHASEAAQRLRGRVRGQRVGVPLHQRGLDARHGQQLRQLIDVEVAHAWRRNKMLRNLFLSMGDACDSNPRLPAYDLSLHCRALIKLVLPLNIPVISLSAVASQHSLPPCRQCSEAYHHAAQRQTAHS